MTGPSASAASTARASFGPVPPSDPAPVPGPALAASTPDGDSVLTFSAYAVLAVRLESSGKAGTEVAMAPSVSYSINVLAFPGVFRGLSPSRSRMWRPRIPTDYEDADDQNPDR